MGGVKYVAIRVTPVVAKRPFCRKGCSDYQALWSGMAQNLAYLVVAGDGAGRFDLMNWYDTVEAGATAFEAFGADEDFQGYAIAGCRSVGEVVSPWIGRMIFGSAPMGSKPVVVHRDYHAASAVQKALELAPELQTLWKA